MANIRVEFLRLGEGGKPLNVIADVLSDGVHGLAVTSTASLPGDVPAVPGDSYEFGVAVRLIASDGNVMVAWGSSPVATLTNSVCIVPGVPEVIYMKSGDRLSFVAES